MNANYTEFPIWTIPTSDSIDSDQKFSFIKIKNMVRIHLF